MGEVQWEAEFFALQDSNQRLAGALREANAAAAQWRQQLEAQRAEAERLRQRVRTPPPHHFCPWTVPSALAVKWFETESFPGVIRPSMSLRAVVPPNCVFAGSRVRGPDGHRANLSGREGGSQPVGGAIGGQGADQGPRDPDFEESEHGDTGHS